MKTLLIVENNKRDRQDICTTVHRSGISIDIILECDNAEDALYILSRQKVDVMITAIEMPKSDGISLIYESKKLEYPPKVIVISGCDRFIYAVQLLRLGVRDYLLKPLNSPQLIDTLTTLDEETNASYKTQENNAFLYAQQLSRLLLQSIGNKSYIEAPQSLKNLHIFQESYVVCCLDNQGQTSYLTKGKCYISNIEQCELYILNLNQLDTIRLQEWRRRFVGVSTPYIGIEHLYQAYLEAFSSRIQAYYKEKHLVSYTPITISSPSISPSFDVPVLVNLLGTDKAPQVVKALHTLIWNAKHSENLSFLQDNISLFFQALDRNYHALVIQEEYEVNNLKHPFSYSMISAYEYTLSQWLDDFIVKLHTQLSECKDKEKMQEAISYISQNYNKDFNMAVVSNHVSMNYSLFSIAFKQYTGTNFVNYLKQIRMEKAKDYLQNSNTKISEISKNIGYENEKHFMKTFKALYGVSPTEYRKNLQLKSSSSLMGME